jgi:hypothetical protein
MVLLVACGSKEPEPKDETQLEKPGASLPPVCVTPPAPTPTAPSPTPEIVKFEWRAPNAACWDMSKGDFALTTTPSATDYKILKGENDCQLVGANDKKSVQVVNKCTSDEIKGTKARPVTVDVCPVDTANRCYLQSTLTIHGQCKPCTGP